MVRPTVERSRRAGRASGAGSRAPPRAGRCWEARYFDIINIISFIIIILSLSLYMYIYVLYIYIYLYIYLYIYNLYVWEDLDIVLRHRQPGAASGASDPPFAARREGSGVSPLSRGSLARSPTASRFVTLPIDGEEWLRLLVRRQHLHLHLVVAAAANQLRPVLREVAAEHGRLS